MLDKDWLMVKCSGRHSQSESNLAGHEILEFCAINSQSIMNNWFQKKEMHYIGYLDPSSDQEVPY